MSIDAIRNTARDYGYIVQLAFPPTKHNPTSVTDAAHELTGKFNFTNVNFSDYRDEVVLASPPSQGPESTKCGIYRDRIVVEKGPIETISTLESFTQNLEEILSVLVKRLALPVFIQQNVLRVIANPSGTNDSREFLIFKMSRFQPDELKHFSRSFHAVGLRWFFPAASPVEPEFDVKIETLLRNPNLLFIENKADFRVPIPVNDVKQVIQNLETTKKFIYDNVFNFMEQFRS